MKTKTKTAQHTPGPWTIEHGKFANSGQIFIEGNESGNHHKQGVCKLGYAYDKAGNDLREPNARLIAAAPDLLAACEMALKVWEDDPRHPFGGVSDTLRISIAKAKGTK